MIPRWTAGVSRVPSTLLRSISSGKAIIYVCTQITTQMYIEFNLLKARDDR